MMSAQIQLGPAGPPKTVRTQLSAGAGTGEPLEMDESQACNKKSHTKRGDKATEG